MDDNMHVDSTIENALGSEITIYYTWDRNEELPKKGIINSLDGQMVNVTTVQYDSWFDVNIGPIDVERHKFRICDKDWARLVELANHYRLIDK